MTALLGASVLLIAGAALALVFGWISADERLIWTSIVASVASAVLLALAYFRSTQEAARAAAAERSRQGRDDPGTVIAFADRARYHRPGCRYAAAKGGERMSVETAKRRGYDACGVCRPARP